ncbi:MFS transporter [Xylogone sp. PMI_703]|nr:MFS transporter [Xylogone sp. PMI_703]
MAANNSTWAQDTIEFIELPAVQPRPLTTTPIRDKQNGLEELPSVLPEPVRRKSTFRTLTVMVALFSTLFITALNTTTVSTSIPKICSDLHSASGYSWIGASYVIASTAVVPIWAKLSDIWGRKPILLVAVALYFASSIVCALSNSMGMLIVSRTLQGAAGGGITPIVNIIISDLYSMRTRSLFLSLLQVNWAVAGGVGPVVGGAFTQLLSWRWNFWINLPICGAAFCLLLFFLDVHNPKTRFSEGVKAIDWFGSVSIVGLMVMILLGLNFGGATYPWGSPKVICLIVGGALVAIVFLFSESRFARHPIMPLGMFRNKSNAACLFIGFVQHFVLQAAEYYLPLYFQSAKEASPFRSGALLLPLMVTESLMSVAAGIYIHHNGRYVELIWAGVILLTLGSGLYINLNATTSVGSTIAFEVVVGLGAGLLFDPPLIALQAHVSQGDTATSTATLGFICNVGVALSIVIGDVIFQNGMQLQRSTLQDQGLPADLVKDLSGPDAAINIDLIGTISNQTQRLAVRQAFAWSLRNFWIMCACMAGCCLLVSGLVTKKELSREHTETQTGLREKENVAVAIPEGQEVARNAANREEVSA